MSVFDFLNGFVFAAFLLNVKCSSLIFDFPPFVVSLLTTVLCVLCFRDFLPRGSGIVTRRPLVLQLMNCPTGKYMLTINAKEVLLFHVMEHR